MKYLYFDFVVLFGFLFVVVRKPETKPDPTMLAAAGTQTHVQGQENLFEHENLIAL